MEISISKEELQKKSLFVATPMYGGMNHGLYAKACLDLHAMCMQYGVKIKFSFLDRYYCFMNLDYLFIYFILNLSLIY
jgi:hypothetical protein